MRRLQNPQSPAPRSVEVEPKVLKFILFGGAFDPIHRGHLDVVETLRARFPEALQVCLIPVGAPPHKPPRELSPPHIRYALAVAATLNLPWCRILDEEIRRMPEVAYTIDTLEAFHATHGTRPHEVAFVLGADAFMQWHTWKQFPRHLEMAHWWVMGRAPHTRKDVEAYVEEHIPGPAVVSPAEFDPEAHPQIVLFEDFRSPVSATDVRSRIGAGRPFEHLVPPAVAALIHRYGWYRSTRKIPVKSAGRRS